MNIKIVGIFISILLIFTTFPQVSSTDKEVTRELPVNTLFLPDYFSWTDYEGADWTTYVKNQGSCGCVSFSAIGAMEAAINIAKGDPNFDRDLSEQYVLSCLPAADSCSGGWASEVIRLIKDTGPSGNNINGCPLESCMPYQADDTIPCDNKCEDWDYYTIPPQDDNILWQVKDFGVTSISEDDPNGWNLLKNWLLNYGPIIVDIYASSSWINFWGSHHSPDDVYQLDDSGTTNYAQLLCGWVDDPSVVNGGYWILKNSWGTSWGYNGFSNIAYGCNSLGTRDVAWVETMDMVWNNPPNTPIYLTPSNHEINVDIDEVLIWICSDPDGDDLTYDVYFGTSSNPPLVAEGILEHNYNPGIMNLDTKYHWKIVAEDEHGASKTGPIWDFTTSSEPPNNPPYKPYFPSPGNGSINQPLDIVLSWSGGDPDPNDTVTYDVYFGSLLPIQMIASNISDTSFNPGNLVGDLTYFWSIIAWDNHGASTVSPSWHFTTRRAANNPPYKPCKPRGELSGRIGQNYTYITNATDSDGDYVYYMWDWGDGTNSSWLGPYGSGLDKGTSHAWESKGTYSIRVKAKDVFNAESDWSEPLEVSMPKNRAINTSFMRFLQQHQILYQIFQRLLNL